MWTYDQELAAVVRVDEAESITDVLPIMTDEDVEAMYFKRLLDNQSVYA